MGIYYVAIIALALFYIGFGTGYNPGDDDAPRLRGIGSVFIGGVVSLIIWGAALEGVRAPAAGVTALIFIAVFGSLFIFGLGRVLGSFIPLCFAEGPRRLVAVAVTTGLPAACVAWILYSVSMAEAALQAQHAAARDVMQSNTHRARFGAHDISLPGAPVLHVQHPCGNRRNRCSTMFWYSPGWNNRPDGELEVFSFGLVTHRFALDALAKWCARQDALSGSLWCTLTSEDSMRFKRADELRGIETEREVQCSIRYTRQIGCRLTHDVAPGVATLLTSAAETEEAATADILARRARAEAIWASVIGDGRP